MLRETNRRAQLLSAPIRPHVCWPSVEGHHVTRSVSQRLSPESNASMGLSEVAHKILVATVELVVEVPVSMLHDLMEDRTHDCEKNTSEHCTRTSPKPDMCFGWRACHCERPETTKALSARSFTVFSGVRESGPRTPSILTTGPTLRTPRGQAKLTASGDETLPGPFLCHPCVVASGPVELLCLASTPTPLEPWLCQKPDVR